ncbi:hypothetical protein H4R34_005903 [Dimargaris verticillata]|uniref:Uncharacterized protein n=1 Tax=Dimargaris verticillata TaxID=2761393 RepID=A0A9W8B1H8_9FUNG|nr:hypothetical protein H4R34_005903 [Dimargaris verticillata]
MQALDLDFHLALSNATAPDAAHRVPFMVNVRNQLLEPLEQYAEYHHQSPYTKVIFLDSTYFCAHSILSLLATADTQQADLACGLNFSDAEGALQFSDTWTARDIAGRAFDQDPADLVSDAQGRQRLEAQLPFQVQACWNGLAVLDAAFFYDAHNTTFRVNRKDECVGPETLLLAQDLAREGLDRFVVDPTVRVTNSAATWELLQAHGTLLPPAVGNTTALPTEVAYVEGSAEVYCAPVDVAAPGSQNKNGTWVSWA